MSSIIKAKEGANKTAITKSNDFVYKELSEMKARVTTLEKSLGINSISGGITEGGFTTLQTSVDDNASTIEGIGNQIGSMTFTKYDSGWLSQSGSYSASSLTVASGVPFTLNDGFNLINLYGKWDGVVAQIQPWSHRETVETNLTILSNSILWAWADGNNSTEDILVNGVEKGVFNVTHTRCVILNIS